VLRRFKCYFALLEIFDEKDFLVVWGRLQVHKKYGKRELDSELLNIPDVYDRVAEVLNFRFYVGRIYGVMHVF
jgi:hypothetical protein